MTNTMTNKSKMQELLDHVQDYCMKNECCDGCPFNRYYGCLFINEGDGDTPNRWHIDELKEELDIN